MVSSASLKPCPFCGGQAIMAPTYDGLFMAQCIRCGIGTMKLFSPKDVEDRWNRRVEDAEGQDDL